MPYLDYAATTPTSKHAIDTMLETMEIFYGNPSSLHDEGIKARKWMNQHKNTVARLMHADRKQILFTSSGTEAINLAIKGMYFKHPNKQYITTTIEHHATSHAIDFIESLGANVKRISVNPKGYLNYDELETALKENETALISVIYANNEIGSLQDVQKITTLAKQYGAKVHLDMVQAPLYLPIDVQVLDVDFISISGHKFHGPRGIGCLYVKDITSIENLIHGGKQEFSKRSGTENLPAIAGFTVALEDAYGHAQSVYRHTQTLATYFLELLNEHGIIYRLNGPNLEERRLPNILNIGFKDQDAQMLSFELNQHGVYVSLGSACNSDNIEPSHVLKAINVPQAYIHGSIRFSFSIQTTKDDIKYTVDTLAKLLS
ncbi:MAG: cysteine desulfurase family protein [Bacillota bacterium]